MDTGTLSRYRHKRDFAITPEPADEPPARRRRAPAVSAALSFVVQKHAARRLHYDFRLELDGVLKSWAVPKGPSLDPADKRMAVEVEDHPLAYGGFEGTIPAGQYGAGTVIVWDHGTWVPDGDPRQGLEEGKLKFELQGQKLHGHWTLVRMHAREADKDSGKPAWLLIKERDDQARVAAEYSVVDEEPDSVLGKARSADANGKAAKAAGKPARRAAAHAKPAATESSASKAIKTPKTAKTPKAVKAAQTAEPAPTLPAGATPAEMPLALSPQLAMLVDQAPSSGDWIYEIKFDGYRVLARVLGGEVRLFTRNGHDWTSKMPALARGITALALPDCWLDGEIVVPGPDGVPSFQLLQNAFDASQTSRLQYYVFDLPWFSGHDLRQAALRDRRALLREQLAAAPEGSPVHFSEDFEAPSGDLLATACRLRLEGIIGKRADSAYVSRRAPSWIKLKCTRRQEFVIGGYTDPKGSRHGFGALLLGVHDAAGRLVYAGNVGTGFDAATLDAVMARLKPLAAHRMPFHGNPRDAKGHWVKPRLVAEVSFSEWTDDGRVRHAVFHGLRADKAPEVITREEAMAVNSNEEQGAKAASSRAAGKSAKGSKPAAGTTGAAKPPAAAKPPRPAQPGEARVAGIRITHPDRVIDSSTHLTKLELAEYYEAASGRMLPHLAHRPVSLVRGPEGIGGELFFQKHTDARAIPQLTQLDPRFDPGHEPLLQADSVDALVGSVQMNVIEFHTWNATTAAIEQPDRMTFDLDPGEGVQWPAIREAAALTRALLEELGLKPFLKTSGGKGLHVIVPLVPEHDWDTVKAFSEAVVVHLSNTLPDRFVAKSGPRNRIGKIFIDYLRNGRGATTVCAFSARARPGMGVSIPVSWDELDGLTGGSHWTVRTAGERLTMRADPWAGYGKARMKLAKAMKLLGFKPEAVNSK